MMRDATEDMQHSIRRSQESSDWDGSCVTPHLATSH